MKKLFLLLCLSMVLYAQEGLKKVVYDLASGDLKTFERNVLSGSVKSINYYESNMQELNIAVVIHGDAYKFFVKDLSKSQYKENNELIAVQESFEKRLRSLATTYKVKFYVCQAGLNHLKIPMANIYDFVIPVETATTGLIDRQSEGYAYVPVR